MNSDIKIIDNVIPRGYADQIEQDLLRTSFPWYYIDDVTNVNYGNNSGLAHVAFDIGKSPTEWFPFIKPIIYSIEEASGFEIDQLLRIRVGFLSKSADHAYTFNTPHVDFMSPHYTACYYATDSDGDTIVFDQSTKEVGTPDLSEKVLQDYVAKTNFTIADRASPKKGRVCIFDGLRFHASTKPTQHNRRLVITINYVGKK